MAETARPATSRGRRQLIAGSRASQRRSGLTRPPVRVHHLARHREEAQHDDDLAITARVTRPKPIFVAAFKFLKSVVGRTPKLTIPSPCMLYSQVGRANIDARVYPDLEAFVEDTAAAYRVEIAELYAAGCRYL